MDDQLEKLIADCFERFDAEGESAINEICRAHPEHASALRSYLGAMLFMEHQALEPASENIEAIGPFKILSELGRGGMGVVYRAHDRKLDRVVALKVMSRDLAWDEFSRARFLREAEETAKLQHPGILAIHEVGEHEGRPYLVMEYLDGRPLSEMIEDLKSCPDINAAIAELVPQALHPKNQSGVTDHDHERLFLGIFLEVASALKHAHDSGVIHRDIKPSNIMITEGGQVVLIDFGLAIREEDGTRLTLPGQRAGSLAYMSPEQLRNPDAEVARHVDIYSLGLSLYECLALGHPFIGDNEDEIRTAILTGLAPPLRHQNPGLTREIQVVCQKAMELDPERRYRSLPDLSDDLKRILQRQPIKAKPLSPFLRGRRWVERNPMTTLCLILSIFVLVLAPLAITMQASAGISRVSRQKAQFLAEKNIAIEERKTADSEAEFAKGSEKFSRNILEQTSGWVWLDGSQHRENLEREIASILAELPTESLLRGRLALSISQQLSRLHQHDAALPLVMEAIAIADSEGDSNLREAAYLHRSRLRLDAEWEHENTLKRLSKTPIIAGDSKSLRELLEHVTTLADSQRQSRSALGGPIDFEALTKRIESADSTEFTPISAGLMQKTLDEMLLRRQFDLAERIVDKMQTKIPAGTSPYLETVFIRGEIEYRRDKSAAGLEKLKSALTQIAENQDFRGTPTAGLAKVTIGVRLNSKNLNDLAISFFKDSLPLLEGWPEGPQYAATACTCLADIYYRNKSYESSLDYYRQAIAQHILAGKSEPQTARHRHGAGRALRKLKRFPEAIVDLKKSVTYYRARSFPDWAVANVQRDLANCYRDTKRYVEAGQLYDELSAIYQKRDMLRELHFCQRSAGACYFDNHQLELAATRYRKTADVARRAFGDSSVQHALGWHYFAVASQEVYEFEDCVKGFRRAVELCETHGHQGNTVYVFALKGLGKEIGILHRNEEAATILGKAADAVALCPDHRPGHASEIRQLQARNLALAKKFPAAESLFLKIYKDTVRLRPKLAASIAQDLTKFYGDLGKPKQSQEWRQRSSKFTDKSKTKE